MRRILVVEVETGTSDAEESDRIVFDIVKDIMTVHEGLEVGHDLTTSFSVAVYDAVPERMEVT